MYKSLLIAAVMFSSGAVAHDVPQPDNIFVCPAPVVCLVVSNWRMKCYSNQEEISDVLESYTLVEK